MANNIYLMISKTSTRFGYMIRKVGGIQYNHCAISLDRNLDELYSFARIQHNSMFLTGIVKETVSRYTLNGSKEIDVVVFKIPVTLTQYLKAQEEIMYLYGQDDYLYNLFSVLTYPLTHGFATYQSYTCIEFVIHILESIGFEFEYPGYSYRPDDLLDLFADYIYYQGDLLNYVDNLIHDEKYFAPVSFDVVKKSAICFGKIVGRTLFIPPDKHN
ncbi:MAG: hypothetical protein ACLRT4_01340 [Thomasclavelia sp.]